MANATGNKKTFNREYPIQGREAFTHIDAVKSFFETYSPEVKVGVLPSGIINILALFNKKMKFVKAMDAYFKHSKERFLAEEYDTYKDLGEPKFTLQQYAESLKSERLL